MGTCPRDCFIQLGDRRTKMRHVQNHVTGKLYDSFSIASFELGEFAGLSWILIRWNQVDFIQRAQSIKNHRYHFAGTGEECSLAASTIFVLTIQEKWIYRATEFVPYNQFIKMRIPIECHSQWFHSQKMNNFLDVSKMVWADCIIFLSELFFVFVSFYLSIILTAVSFIPNESVHVLSKCI